MGRYGDERRQLRCISTFFLQPRGIQVKKTLNRKDRKEDSTSHASRRCGRFEGVAPRGRKIETEVAGLLVPRSAMGVHWTWNNITTAAQFFPLRLLIVLKKEIWIG